MPLTIDYAGNEVLQPSSTTVDLTLQTPTKNEFTGPEFIANGEAATLAGHLTDYQDNPVAGKPWHCRPVREEAPNRAPGQPTRQAARPATIAAVNQPLNDTATVPAAAVFNGDCAYLGSSAGQA
ncbi:hypothetical protein [Glycomyces sp. YM15]|uniref:hypothetical protein n=1 Tax=Glycomyces sp. YM15 TaxID=2800446 RepID=UPI0019646B55|nr:hypothetical protein [Glycomyces sp. YM15]